MWNCSKHIGSLPIFLENKTISKTIFLRLKKNIFWCGPFGYLYYFSLIQCNSCLHSISYPASGLEPMTSWLQVFSLNHFDDFFQTLLYNLFDIAQSRAAPIIVVGLTTELDVVESLEKRVKSRFNHRQITMFPTDNFKQYFNDVKNLLSVDNSHDWNAKLVKHFLRLFGK